jgi:hypothetical protein
MSSESSDNNDNSGSSDDDRRSHPPTTIPFEVAAEAEGDGFVDDYTIVTTRATP